MSVLLFLGFLVAKFEVSFLLHLEHGELINASPEEEHGYFLNDETENVAVEIPETFAPISLVNVPNNGNVGVYELKEEYFLDQRIYKLVLMLVVLHGVEPNHRHCEYVARDG